MGKSKSGKPKRKKVPVKLLKRVHAGQVTEPYRIMEELIENHHQNLKDVKIVIAWRFGWSANADGLMTMGRAKKCTDLDRQLADFDFVLLLNHEAWNKGGLSEKQRAALIDHELCHCEVTMDSNGEPKYNEDGRLVCRIRKHDIEEFQDVVARHGCYTHDLAEFANKSIKDSDRPLLAQQGDGVNSSEVAGDSDEAIPENVETMPIDNLAQYAKKKKISPRQIQALFDAGLDTVGKLIAHMRNEGEWWARSITGIGRETKVPIEDAVARIQTGQ